ncbi:uncharacterized protein AKAW2_10653S [Aspergillus luchuensis]|uniref:Uncharacterized protein n=1 Tax=Aspergillus kawachii TaxID=1069201 RepID=A0A7R7VZG8_ASPKA|nr:uncharacterized protein AKAW2_10653S [Aspergillus luchuensis]BCR93607.1 hypothetical protein AKAW2_10653S [Aspergillus luchuensis]GAA88922.1 hypothetical protein AKAW_07036 [Aspergillus luchuensis IFO 4308]
MSLHQDYSTSSEFPPSQITAPIDVGSHIVHRDGLITELIARLKASHIVRVRGTPASGKTTIVNLLANKLLDCDPNTPLYVMSGWDVDMVTRAKGWAGYLEQRTGVHGRSWLTQRGYLLIDEAQQSYWDVALWADLFKAVDPSSQPYIVLFMSYGSPDRGFSGFERKYMATPMIFGEGQEISLRPDINIQSPWKPVGLLMEENEAIQVIERCAPQVIPDCGPLLTPALKQGLFKSSSGHVGLIKSLVLALRSLPVLSKEVRNRRPLEWQTISTAFFSDPMGFFRCLRSLPFSRGLPPARILQIPNVAAVLKAAVASDGILTSSFAGTSKEAQEGLEHILANGWLHAEICDGGERYIFASQIHRWYCQCLFSEKRPDNQLEYDTPLQLALDVIRGFQPCQLAHAPRSLAGSSRPLEDQYQKEFYRCLFPLLDGHVVVSPEFVVQSDIKGGTIDFLITQKKWGLELLRERDRLQEHMDRFKPNGQYYTLIEKGRMDYYIVLDFTTTMPRKPNPEFQNRLYHIVFSKTYRDVSVINGWDLRVVDAFVLMENKIRRYD